MTEEIKTEYQRPDPDLLEIVNALNLRVEPGEPGEQQKLFFDGDSLRAALEKQNQRLEHFEIEDSKNGLHISASSKTKPFSDLQRLVHESYNFLNNKKEIQVPVGVN